MKMSESGFIGFLDLQDCKNPINPDSDIYSVLIDFTGSSFATLQFCTVTVTTVIAATAIKANTNTHQYIDVRYAKFSNQRLTEIHATGTAITKQINRMARYDLLNIVIISIVEAPCTLRIPISFLRHSLSKTTKPIVANLKRRTT